MSKKTTCSVTIDNSSNDTKRFLLFQDMPAPTNGPTGQVFSNVYQAGPKTKSGKTVFQMDSQFYAVYGTASSAGSNVRVTTSDQKLVKLGPGGSVVGLSTVDANGTDPDWDDTSVQGKTTAAKGGFSIVTDHTFKFPNPNAIYIGVGATDPRKPHDIVPIQTYLAEPGLNSQLFPHLKYYICTGEFQPGTIVDRNTIGDCLQLDFTGASVTEAVFSFDSNANFNDDNDTTKTNGVKFSFGPLDNA